VLKNYVETLCRQNQFLNTVMDANKEIPIPIEYKEIAQYQMATLGFGLAYFSFAQKWYSDFIQKIETGAI
jgi:hypothetical protein